MVDVGSRRRRLVHHGQRTRVSRAARAVAARGRWWSATAIIAALFCLSCGSAPALPASPPTVTVTMREYGFDYGRPVPSGRVIFRVRNAGRLPHELLLVVLPPDYPSDLNAQLHSSTRRAVPTRARVPSRMPGAEGFFAVDLGPGRYGIISFVRGADGVTDALHGMSSEFRVG